MLSINLQITRITLQTKTSVKATICFSHKNVYKAIQNYTCYERKIYVGENKNLNIAQGEIPTQIPSGFEISALLCIEENYKHEGVA